MSKSKLSLVIILFYSLSLFAQDVQKEEFKPSGKVTGKVFWNYHYNLTEDANQRHSFEFLRAYFGYSYKFSENISAVILFDGAKKTLSDVDFNQSKKTTSSEYTVFVKNAYLDYRINKNILLSGGIIELKQMDTQDKFWGYRYLYKPFQDEFALGTTADLGINGEFTLIPELKVNLFVLNGEGFTKLQDTLGVLKFGGSLLYAPIEGLIIKGYYDIYGGKAAVSPGEINNDTAFIHTFDFFAGYKNEKIKIGAGYSYKINGKDFYTVAENRDQLGIYATGSYIINKQFEVFGTWFNYKSNKLPNATETWNYNKYDGNILVGGVQFSPLKGVKMALNYRTSVYDNPDLKTKSLLYMNFEFGF